MPVGADEHHVGVAALDDLTPFGDGPVGGCLAHGQGIAWAAKVVVNGQMAGGHVRQILQQPQRRHLRHAFHAPAGELEPALAVPTFDDALDKIVGRRQHIIGAENDAASVRVGRAEGQFRVAERPLGRGHSHLALATHNLQPLANRLFLLFFERPKVVDLAGELSGRRRKRTGIASAESPCARQVTPLRPSERAFQNESKSLPRGPTPPIPVITTLRAACVMQSPTGYSVVRDPWSAGGGRRFVSCEFLMYG